MPEPRGEIPRGCHLAILGRGKAKEAPERMRGVLERLELTLDEKKTSIRSARREQFDFVSIRAAPQSADGS